MKTYRITIIRATRGNLGRKVYSSEHAETYTAQGETWTDARKAMEQQHNLAHVDYITWTVDETND